MITAIEKYHQLSIAKVLQMINWIEYSAKLFYSIRPRNLLEGPTYPCLGFVA